MLLLDATSSYDCEMARHLWRSATRWVSAAPLMPLPDPSHTKVILVTLPEPTPVMEAQGLEEDLERAGFIRGRG